MVADWSTFPVVLLWIPPDLSRPADSLCSGYPSSWINMQVSTYIMLQVNCHYKYAGTRVVTELVNNATNFTGIA